MSKSRWHTSPLRYATVRNLASSLGVSEVMASVLARRGFEAPEAAGRFLSGAGELYDPFLFPEMAAVCSRLKQAIAAREKICVHGDYDVDGITSTALLVDVLRELGAVVDWRLPNRFRDGYGVAAASIEQIAAGGSRLLVTVDCGIAAREAIERAAALGMETIVIDHHRPAEGRLPGAMIISPLLCDYPFKELAGVGLAFKVAQGLLAGEAAAANPFTQKSDVLPSLLQRQLDLVALGTIADVVPLLDENRNLVKRGLVQLARTHRAGLQALMRIGKVEQSRLNAGLVAFRLAPRINAAGRLDDPEPALRLLLTDDEQEAGGLAGHLDGLNRERQAIEEKMVREATTMFDALPEERQMQRGQVFSAPGWHEGVIGIVASRMVERLRRPVIMISENGEHGKGSGRSIASYDLHGSLLQLSHMLEAFGGHRAACGLTIGLEQIPDFQRQFAALADAQLTDKDLEPSFNIDALALGHELTLDLADEMARLEPFGLGNPSVSLLAAGAKVTGASTTRDARHLRCQIDAGGVRSSAIGFGLGAAAEKLRRGAACDVAFRIERHEWNGSVAPQLSLREFFPVTGSPEPAAGICQHRCDFDCPERITGGEFWQLVRNGAPLPAAWQNTAASLGNKLPIETGRLIDRRGIGDIPGQITRLLFTGENVLLAVADLPRRRRQLLGQLPLAGSGIGYVFLAGARCSRKQLEQRLETKPPATQQSLAISDFVTLAEMPQIAGGFDHIVFIDPPFKAGVLESAAAAAPDAYIHLLHCADEVQFTEKVLRHEYDLREPLVKVYKHLEVGKTYPLDETTERLLLAGGKYLRQPETVARCLRILAELALTAVEEKAGQPIMTLLEADRTGLDSSPTYHEIQVFYRECLKFLSKSPDVKMI
ncbi:MAG: single-stranded-DNA-specific exonuclease RecJ [Actinobacteria bacterium]|nr:single-stranded-DNA-specific exonuclease RecJ [Actinomycetota bacterium]MCL6093223.1 single-stranded-DNA-specific exonuclease RecJ [Actinomycetota bacterium]